MNIEVKNINNSSQPDELENRDSSHAYTGSEPIFSVFMQAQVNLQTVRMTIQGRVLHQVSDLVSDIEVARREFRHGGDAIKAVQDTKRIQAVFEQRIQDWNRTASNLERDKRGMSGHELQKMKAEHSRVRTSLGLLNRYFTKLEVELSQIAATDLTNKQAAESAENASKETSLDLPETESTSDEANQISPSEYPGNRVDLSIYRDLKPEATDAFQALCEIIGDRLPVSYQDATRKISGDIGTREHAWDFGSKLCMVIRWIPTQEDPWKTSDLYFWLIPKAQQIHDELLFLKDKVRFRVESREQVSEIVMQPRMPDEQTRPQNKRITILIDKVLEKLGGAENYSFFVLHYPINVKLDSAFQLSIKKIDD